MKKLFNDILYWIGWPFYTIGYILGYLVDDFKLGWENGAGDRTFGGEDVERIA